jgi:nicotinamidase-related amidase
MDELILDPQSTAIVVIDLQKGTVLLPGSPHSITSVIENCARLLQSARSAGVQPILVHVGRSSDGGDALRTAADEPMRFTAPPKPDWTELVPELDRQSNDLVILKRQWGVFYGTDLDLQLRRRGMKAIILCGVATEYGVESTARDAWERGYELIFAEDGMTGLTAEGHLNSITRIFPRIGRVRSTEAIIECLQKSPTQ